VQVDGGLVNGSASVDNGVLRFRVSVPGRRAVPPIVPLEFLRSGERGRIHELDGRPELVCRLEEMGLHPGVVLRMIQPGRPCIVALGEQRLSFRGDEAATLLVETIE
jgi:Fe2+ transport system protein FeoA